MPALALFVAASPQCSTPPADRIFNKVRATMPYSLPNALAVSPDGRWIYCGEGGAMAYLDTHDPDGYLIDAPREPISKYGARPAAILLDEGP